MKQLIVLVASVVLGVTIGGIVLNFGDTATALGSTASQGLGAIETDMKDAMSSAAGITFGD